MTILKIINEVASTINTIMMITDDSRGVNYDRGSVTRVILEVQFMIVIFFTFIVQATVMAFVQFSLVTN